MDSRLGRGVRRAALIVGRPRRAFARSRGHADDAPVAPAHHVRHGGARAEKGRAQVQAEDEVPVLDGHLPDLAVAAAPDVVDEDVEPAESLGRHLDEPGGAAFFREIPRERHGRASGLGDGGRGALELGAVDVAEGHAGTLPRQEERDLPAEPVGRSRHHGHAILDARHESSTPRPRASRRLLFISGQRSRHASTSEDQPKAAPRQGELSPDGARIGYHRAHGEPRDHLGDEGGGRPHA